MSQFRTVGAPFRVRVAYQSVHTADPILTIHRIAEIHGRVRRIHPIHEMENRSTMNRRDFLRATGAGALAWLLTDCAGTSGSTGASAAGSESAAASGGAAGAGSAAALPAGRLVAGAAASARKPNIVVLLADDLGYGGVGFQGCRDIPTPHIDSLADEGVRFTDGYVSCPLCSPTRAGLMSGRYQQRFGHEFNPGPAGNDGEGFGPPASETLFPQRMKALGYATGMVGKWHLGAHPEKMPNARGFDSFYGFLGGANAYTGPNGPKNILRNGEPVVEKQYLTDAFGREAVAFIESHKADPFFLYLAFNAVHTPMQAFSDRLERFASIQDPKRRTHAAMLSAMDDAIGATLKALTAAGLEKDTLVYFLTDNGGPTPSNTSSNAPFRGYKGQVWEGGIRVPFVMRWPGRLPAGNVYAKPVISLDLLATSVAAAGGTVDPAWKLDGVNLLPFLGGPEAGASQSGSPHESLYWRMGEKRAIRHGDWKLVQELGEDKPSLYNLAEDVAEETDRFADRKDVAEDLESKWRTWDSELAAPRWIRLPGDKKKKANAPKRAARRAANPVGEKK